MRWLFECFEGISLVLVQHGEQVEATQVTGLTEVHLLMPGLLGPSYQHYDDSSQEMGRMPGSKWSGQVVANGVVEGKVKA